MLGHSFLVFFNVFEFERYLNFEREISFFLVEVSISSVPSLNYKSLHFHLGRGCISFDLCCSLVASGAPTEHPRFQHCLGAKVMRAHRTFIWMKVEKTNIYFFWFIRDVEI